MPADPRRGRLDAELVLVALVGVAFLAAGLDRIARGELLHAAQCLVGVPIVGLAEFVHRRTRLSLPGPWRVAFAAFVFASFVMGSVHDVYWLIPSWDTLLHAWSAALLVLAGLGLLGALAPDAPARPPLWLAVLFSAAFAAFGGVLWEFVEFATDSLLGTNMQRFAERDGTPLPGREALLDTMRDLQVNALAAGASLAVLAWPLHTSWPGLRRFVPHWRRPQPPRQ